MSYTENAIENTKESLRTQNINDNHTLINNLLSIISSFQYKFNKLEKEIEELKNERNTE